ncbi:MAG: hypothetical protein WAU11_10490 [Ignavibacteriaceae bacterium]
MKNITNVLFVSILLLASCSGSEDLLYRNLDQIIISDFNKLKNDFKLNRIGEEEYLLGLNSLKTKETDLFKKVNLHQFKDIREQNYWHRGRLKFPSNIEMELNRIAETFKETKAIK